MKSYSIIAGTIFLLSLPCAQSQAPSPSDAQVKPDAAKMQTPADTKKTTFYIAAQFTEALNARKLKPGDKIKAEVTQDVLSHGKILIPVETRLVGHVTETKMRTADDPESRLGIVFDKIVLKHHREVSFLGVIQRLEPPAQMRSKVDEPDQMMPPAMYGGGSSGGMSPMGSSTGRGAGMGGTPTSGMTTGLTTTGSIYMNGTPGSNVGNSSGADLGHPSSGTSADPSAKTAPPISTGMPRGVAGIKGLDLSAAPSDLTPGPVIISSVHDIKLEYGTQVLLKATDPYVTKQ